MYKQTQIDLAKHRLDTATKTLEEADLLFENGAYKGGNNRAYYAAFYAIRALFALESVDFKKHSAVIHHFHEQYIKTGIFSPEMSKIISTTSEVRNVSDYDDFFVASKQETQEQIDKSKKLYNTIKTYLETQIKNEK